MSDPSSIAPPAPLAGISVVEFGQFIAGPGASAVLAALGADVVKVEPLIGDATRDLGMSGYGMFRANNRGKRSLAINLRDQAGADVARLLVERSDVLVHNMRPGAMERLGLGAPEMRALNPRLVYASISGFGSDPDRQRPTLDIVAQAESGMMSVNGDPEDGGTRIGFTVADHAAYNMLCHGILAALFVRERTGRGDTVEGTLFHSALALQSSPWSQYFATGVVPIPAGSGTPMVAPAGDKIVLRDGVIVMSAYTDPHWRRLCAMLDRADLLTDPRFVDNAARAQHRFELLAIVRAELGERGADECVAWFVENGIVAGRVRTYADVPGSAPAEAGGVFGTAEGADGTAERFVTLPYRLGGRNVYSAKRPPRLGEHSREVLAELGLGLHDIDKLVSSGVVSDGVQA